MNHVAIRQYHHLGEDIGVSEAKRFTSELTKAIQEIMAIEPKLRGDSPVYKFIDRLTPPSVAEEAEQAVAARRGIDSQANPRHASNAKVSGRPTAS